MNKEVSPRFTSVVLAGFTVVVLGVLAIMPVHIEIKPNVAAAQESPAAQMVADVVPAKVVEYTLRTVLGGDPAMAFVGVGGTIEGVVNPELIANVGDTVRLTVVNGDPVAHDLKIDEFSVYTGELLTDEQSATVEFIVTQPGEFNYYCSVPGHRQIGMVGILRVEGTSDVVEAPAASEDASHDMAAMTTAPAADDAVSIVRNPSDLPPPIGNREPTTVVVNITAVEVNGQLADGTTYHYMTFDGQVPGPMIRILVGDTVEVNLKNDPTSHLSHSIDLHSVTGPGGGAVYTQTLPGAESGFTFKALQPGLYVYHCATASIGQHISSGMYGLVLVEPIGGLPPVDREFYVMQGEIYTAQPFGTKGHLDFSYEKMLDEDAEYFVFNGAAGALTTDENALRANVGETVRIYFGVGGPNAISSFHVIGDIFDKVYNLASVTSAPLTDVQTTLVPSGGATIVEFKLDVPGRYILVDHALSRLERGLVGFLYAEGEADHSIFYSESAVDDAGH